MTDRDLDATIQLRAYLRVHLAHDDWALQVDADGVGLIETDDDALEHELRGAGFDADRENGVVVVTGFDDTADYAHEQRPGAPGEGPTEMEGQR